MYFLKIALLTIVFSASTLFANSFTVDSNVPAISEMTGKTVIVEGAAPAPTTPGIYMNIGIGFLPITPLKGTISKHFLSRRMDITVPDTEHPTTVHARNPAFLAYFPGKQMPMILFYRTKCKGNTCSFDSHKPIGIMRESTATSTESQSGGEKERIEAIKGPGYYSLEPFQELKDGDTYVAIKSPNGDDDNGRNLKFWIFKMKFIGNTPKFQPIAGTGSRL